MDLPVEFGIFYFHPIRGKEVGLTCQRATFPLEFLPLFDDVLMVSGMCRWCPHLRGIVFVGKSVMYDMVGEEGDKPMQRGDKPMQRGGRTR